MLHESSHYPRNCYYSPTNSWLKSIDLLSLKIKLQCSNILIPNWLKCLLKISFSSFLEVYLWIFRTSFWRYSNDSILWAWYSTHLFSVSNSLLFHQRYWWVTVMGNLVAWVDQGRGIYFPRFSLFCFLRDCLLGMGSWFNFVGLFRFFFQWVDFLEVLISTDCILLGWYPLWLQYSPTCKTCFLCVLLSDWGTIMILYLKYPEEQTRGKT